MFSAWPFDKHYNNVIMGAIVCQITSVTIVYSTVYSGTDQRKYQNSASLAFVRGFHRWRASNTENVSIWWRHHGRYRVYPDDPYCSEWPNVSGSLTTVPGWKTRHSVHQKPIYCGQLHQTGRATHRGLIETRRCCSNGLGGQNQSFIWTL